MGISGYGINGGGSNAYSVMQRTPSSMMKQQAEQSPQSTGINLPKTAVISPANNSALPTAPNSATGKKSPAQDALEGEQKARVSEQKQKDSEGCQTCENRKYQDGSDDPSVSFKNPTNVDPSVAASTVRGHEMEHVFNEQSKAQREQRRIISQTVVLHSGICSECGKTYISGGTTRTVSKADTARAIEQYKKNSAPIEKSA